MIENQSFSLEKIKDLTSSIDVLQAKLYQLNENYVNIKIFNQSVIPDFTNKVFLFQIEEVINLVSDLKNILENISKDNINSFLNLQECLIKKFKQKNQERLKRLKLNQGLLREIGLYLIEKRKINKTIHEISFVPSIEVAQWIEILDSLKQNSLFLSTIKKIDFYYENLIQDKLKLELSKIPKDTDLSLIKDFEVAFLKDPNITFPEFLKDIESKLTQKELETKKLIIAKAKEREELEKLKKKQEEQKEAYKDYLKLSDKAFERKIRKKTREKLSDIRTTDKKTKKIEISDEVSEKIEKFKSKLDKSFEEKYLIQKNDEQDPLDLIRERKIKKEKEYKKYKNHFLKCQI
ncbi:MAG: hypothetical protein ACFFG0_29235 [Candidatus Thorarchaeota archaeon]